MLYSSGYSIRVKDIFFKPIPNKSRTQTVFISRNCLEICLLTSQSFIGCDTAHDFLSPRNDTEDESKRIAEALKEIEEHGTYELDVKELVYGAKTAWRNSVRCIGRIQWNKLQVAIAYRIHLANFAHICKSNSTHI